jgi:hypothetical protein
MLSIRRKQGLLAAALATVGLVGALAGPAHAGPTTPSPTVSAEPAAELVARAPALPTSEQGFAAPSAVPTALPEVTVADVMAASAKLARCGCRNVPQVKYALKQLGVKSLNQKLLRKRLGTRVGDIAYVSLVASLSPKAAKVRRTVPFPSYRATSAIKYRKTPYRVYEIYGTGLGPVYPHWTWKYGITRQMIPKERPGRQVPACTRYFGPQYLLGGRCTFKWLWIGLGWLQARTVEASYTLVYAIGHDGYCPPGMPQCV